MKVKPIPDSEPLFSNAVHTPEMWKRIKKFLKTTTKNPPQPTKTITRIITYERMKANILLPGVLLSLSAICFEFNIIFWGVGFAGLYYLSLKDYN